MEDLKATTPRPIVSSGALILAPGQNLMNSTRIGKEIYKGESKVGKDQTIICSIFENTPSSADVVAAAFIQ